MNENDLLTTCARHAERFEPMNFKFYSSHMISFFDLAINQNEIWFSVCLFLFRFYFIFGFDT